MRDSRCFYSDPVHQLSQVRDIGASELVSPENLGAIEVTELNWIFPHHLLAYRGHNICLMNCVLVYLDTKSTAELS